MRFAYIAIAVLLIFTGAFYIFYPQHPLILMKQVSVGTTTVAVEVADTDASREHGLSGRASLKEGQGMLFVFDEPGLWAFWMKDMHFAIDIIFADAEGKIVTIYKNISPETYLQNPPHTFPPTSPALYVLEVPAGFVVEHNISQGMKLVVQ